MESLGILQIYSERLRGAWRGGHLRPRRFRPDQLSREQLNRPFMPTASSINWERRRFYRGHGFLVTRTKSDGRLRAASLPLSSEQTPTGRPFANRSLRSLKGSLALGAPAVVRSKSITSLRNSSHPIEIVDAEHGLAYRREGPWGNLLRRLRIGAPSCGIRVGYRLANCQREQTLVRRAQN